MRTRGVVGLAGVLLLGLYGCATVPTSGPVVQTTRGVQSGKELGVAISPDPPVKGATPGLIVDGFLHAMTSSVGDYAAARQFLTAEAQRSWQPRAGVNLYADGYSPKQVGDNVILNAPLVGKVGPDGAFAGAGQASVSQDFRLVKDADDQWRISNPPAGLLLSSYLFNTSFGRLTTYFAEPGGSSMVPNPLYVPRMERTPTKAISLLLSGPTAWLKPAVRSEIPQGTNLVGQVDVDSYGVATVPLSGQVRALGERGRVLVLAQVGWSLRQFPEISGVRILADGRTLETLYQRSDGSVSQASLDEFDPVAGAASTKLFGFIDGRLVTLADSLSGMRSLPTTGPFGTGRVEARTFAVNSNGTQAAVVTAGGQVLLGDVAGTQQPQVIYTNEGLLRPQFGRSGELWLVANSKSGANVQRWADGKLQPVSAPGLAGVTLSSFRVSPDGTRMAAIGEIGGKLQLGLLRVDRAGPVTLSAWTTLALTDLSMPHDMLPDVAWASPTSLVVLAGSSTRMQAEAYIVDQDASLAVDIGRSENWGAVAITALPKSGSRLMLLGEGGTVWRYEDAFRWTQVLTGVTAIAYPG